MGVHVEATQGGDFILNIQNNNILLSEPTSGNPRGIFIWGQEGALLDGTILNNTVVNQDTTALEAEAIYILFPSASGAASTTCFDIRNNSVATSASDGNYGLLVLSASGSNMMGIVGIGNPNPTPADVVAYLQANNSSASGSPLIAGAWDAANPRYTSAAACRLVP